MDGHRTDDIIDHEGLGVLLQAPSKAAVNQLFMLAFRARHGATEAHLRKAVGHLGEVDGGVGKVRHSEQVCWVRMLLSDP